MTLLTGLDPKAKPQLEQNWAPGTYAVPHRVHRDNVAGYTDRDSRLKILDARPARVQGMKRSTWLIIAVNVYGIIAAVLALLGILRTPIIIVPFILTPFIVDPLRKSLSNTRYRYLSLAIATILIIAIVLVVILVLTN